MTAHDSPVYRALPDLPLRLAHKVPTFSRYHLMRPMMTVRSSAKVPPTSYEIVVRV